MPYPKRRSGKIVAWMAEVRIQGHPRVTEQCRTKSEAREREAELKKELREKARPDATPTILEFATRYLEHCERYTARTFQEKKEALDLLAFHFGKNTLVSEIRTGEAHEILHRVSRRRSGYAANKARKNLVAAWNWGKRFMRGWPSENNPFAAVDKFPYQKQGKYVPPMRDVETVLNTMLREGAKDDHCMLLCYLHTGARRSELFNLRPCDLDFSRSKITLWTRKRADGTWYPDVIPMTSQLRDALIAHIARNGQKERVFMWRNVLTGRERPFRERRHWLEYWCGMAGVRRFSFHSVRHLTASWLDACGVPLRTIQAILRHQSATTTDRYLHELRGAQADLDQVFGEERKGKLLSMGGENEKSPSS